MKDAIQVLCTHAARTLPDSISERKSVLRAMEKLMGHDHPARRLVASQIAAIMALEKLNSELPLKFSSHLKGDGNGDVDGGGE
jgi:hypothetical protein